VPGERGDPVAEHVLGVRGAVVVQDLGEIRAVDLDLAAEQRRRERGPPAASRVDEHLRAHAGPACGTVRRFVPSVNPGG
jgi:hypothetical protein